MGLAYGLAGSRLGLGLARGYGAAAPPAGDWWAVSGKTCVAAYAPKGAASLAASYSNLANPGTYNAAPGEAPTFDGATGWTFNGTSQFLRTGVVPLTSSWSMIVRYSSITNDGALCGTGESGKLFNLQRYDNAMYYANGTYTATAGDYSGTLAMAGLTGYRDGSSSGAIGAAWSEGTYPFNIGAWGPSANPVGPAALFGACTIQALAIYSDTLTAGEVAALHTAITAL